MTNILSLPQFPVGTAINLLSNVDWTDTFFVPQPGFLLATPLVLSGSLSSSAATFTVSDSAGVLPGMLVEGYGVADGTIVQTVDPTVITMSGDAEFTAPVASLTFLPPPLDLTGIAFSSTLRTAVRASEAILQLTTDAGTMTNGGAGGQFGWAVPAAKMLAAPWPAALATQGVLSCLLDVIASDASGAKINLCAANGPIIVNVSLSITR